MEDEEFEEVIDPKLEKELMALKKLNNMRLEARTLKKTLGPITYLRHLPYPMQAIGGIVIVIALVAALGYWPIALDYLLVNWLPQGMEGKTLFTASILGNLIFGMFSFITFMFGGPAPTFIKAKLLKRDIVEMYLPSGRKTYKAPKEEVPGFYDLGPDMTVKADSQSYYSGPGGMRMTSVMPEIPTTFNPRKFLEGQGTGLDMMSMKIYGKQHEQKMWEKMRSGSDMFIKIMPWIMAMMILGAIFGPMAWERVSDLSSSNTYFQQYEQCKIEMLESGCIPDSLKEKYKPKEPEQPVDPTEIKPAFGGMRLDNK